MAAWSTSAAAQLPTKPLAPPPQDTGACMCTMSFALVDLEVRRPDGTPATDARLEIRRADGTRFNPPKAGAAPVEGTVSLGGAGHYPLVDDGSKASIRALGEVLHVEVREGKFKASVRVTVGVPGRCRCHVQRLAGPSVVTLK